MSGICGVLDRASPLSQAELARFTAALLHRGPDGHGLMQDGELALGNARRLAGDGSGSGAGPLPHGGADGQRYWIALDGALYDTGPIERELTGLGHTLGSRANEVVMAAAYAAWGIDAFARFNGDWAAALWDREARRLLLVRDRHGVKPLFVMTAGPRLAFASELKAFLELEGFVARLDETAARAALAADAAAAGGAEATLLQGVQRLLPGHALSVDAEGRVMLQRWWDTRARQTDIPGDYRDQVTEFQALLQDAVAIRSQAPRALCLSGGVGAGAIAACLPSPADAFTALFAEAGIDESGLAAAVAGGIGARLHPLAFPPELLAEHLAQAVWAAESTDLPAALASWCLFGGIRSHGFHTALAGFGAADLLAGQAWHLDWPLIQLNDALAQAVTVSRLPSQLALQDGCAMAHGVALRLPFLDWRIVNYCLALPPEAKIGDGQSQRILRDAVRGEIPDPIRLRRTKLAMIARPASLLNGPLAGVLRRAVEHPLWQDSPFWQGRALATECLAKSAAGGWQDSDELIWRIFGLLLWQMLFIERRSPSALWD